MRFRGHDWALKISVCLNLIGLSYFAYQTWLVTTYEASQTNVSISRSDNTPPGPGNHQMTTKSSTLPIATAKNNDTIVEKYLKLASMINDKPTLECKSATKVGNDEAHETYRFCQDEEFHDPKTKRLLPTNCVVYSFGINNEFSFDDQFASRFNCNVYSFDMTMGKESHNRSDKVHFFNLGITGFDYGDAKKKKNTTTLKDLMKRLGHRSIHFLKMDIENDEWSSLQRAIKEGLVARVHHFSIEWHLMYEFDHFDEIGNLDMGIQVQHDLHEIGFRKYHGQPWLADPKRLIHLSVNDYVNVNFFSRNWDEIDIE